MQKKKFRVGLFVTTHQHNIYVSAPAGDLIILEKSRVFSLDALQRIR